MASTHVISTESFLLSRGFKPGFIAVLQEVTKEMMRSAIEKREFEAMLIGDTHTEVFEEIMRDGWMKD